MSDRQRIEEWLDGLAPRNRERSIHALFRAGGKNAENLRLILAHRNQRVACKMMAAPQTK